MEAEWKLNGSELEVDWEEQNRSRMKEHTFFYFRFVIKYYWIPGILIDSCTAGLD